MYVLQVDSGSIDSKKLRKPPYPASQKPEKLESVKFDKIEPYNPTSLGEGESISKSELDNIREPKELSQKPRSKFGPAYILELSADQEDGTPEQSNTTN